MARKIGHGAAMALGAGLFGALAATAAKLSLGGERMKRREIGVEAEGLHLLLRVGCGGLVFLCNALMWTFFAKSLRYSSSAQASLTTNASNFLLSRETPSSPPSLTFDGKVTLGPQYPVGENQAATGSMREQWPFSLSIISHVVVPVEDP
ncbi:transmembrane protein 42a isoform X1 [Narcine bancroftii]|uniref:transmembrane protein 42a isoform X1 n=1 Tax=Narcine bancroftii TaxID=1343680 RepID=UPI0038319815